MHRHVERWKNGTPMRIHCWIKSISRSSSFCPEASAHRLHGEGLHHSSDRSGFARSIAVPFFTTGQQTAAMIQRQSRLLLLVARVALETMLLQQRFSIFWYKLGRRRTGRGFGSIVLLSSSSARAYNCSQRQQQTPKPRRVWQHRCWPNFL